MATEGGAIPAIRWSEIPDPAEPVEDLAEWWAAFGAKLNRRVFEIRQRVEDYVRSVTTVTTPHGTLRAASAGWEWDEQAIALAYPELTVQETATFAGTREQIERILSVATEEVPDIKLDVACLIDKRKADAWVKAGGEKGEHLAELREKKKAKVVVE